MLITFAMNIECVRDLIYFPVDQKYKIIIENHKKIKNRPIIMTVVP